MDLFFKILTAFILGVILNLWGLTLLRRYKFSQSVRVEGPKSHYQKEGTPTMGGLMILSTIVIAALLLIPQLSHEAIILLTMFVGTGLIGALDDYLKISRGKNKGLSGRQKLFGQFIIAALFCTYLLSHNFHLMVSPLLHYIGMNNPVLYVLLSSFIIIGTSNAVNLTDGLDGLATGVVGIILFAFAFIAYQFGNLQLMQLALISAVACFAFLVINYHPAKVFMGDVGSLALGTLLAGFALLLHAELYLFFAGIVLVLETLSVIIQVGYFKISKGKRIFKMAPLHHHCELSGMKETKIVWLAWWTTLLAVLLTIALRIR